jgi:hypothetical protein
MPRSYNPRLRFVEDGSLTLYIQKESPGLDLEANWLPTPAGRFYLNARAYMPQPRCSTEAIGCPRFGGAPARERLSITGDGC